MKKALKPLLLLLLIGSSACERFLPEPENPMSLIDTEEDCIQAISGAYSRFYEAMSYHNLYTAKSDDLNLRLLYTNCRFTAELPLDMNEDFFRQMYKAVIMCNRIIHDLNTIGEVSFKDAYLGEAYFLRAYIYFKLVRIYGRIPLVEDVNVNYELELPETIDIYQFIVSDLDNAETLLPQNAFTARISGVTPHLGVVKAVKAEVYLTMAGYPLNDESYYRLAASTARDVIEHRDEYGFGLADDYADLWAWDTHGNPESIWRYYEEPDRNSPFYSFRRLNWWTIYQPPRIDYYKSFPGNYRKEVSVATRYAAKATYVIDSTDYQNRVLVSVDTTDICKFYDKCYGKKQTYNFQTGLIRGNDAYLWNSSVFPLNVSASATTVNINLKMKRYYHLLRYAHTLLTYAEAKARIGEADESAYEALNMIRRRAEKLDPDKASVVDLVPGSLDAAAFADKVVEERKWEFCQEFEGRWFDIVRLDLMDEIEAARQEDDFIFNGIETLYQGEKYFVPLPQSDIWLNPNLDQ